MNRQLGKSEIRCIECDATFENEAQFKEHFHSVLKVSDDVYVLLIPAIIKPGSWEAAQAFAKARQELKLLCPGKNFSFSVFEYKPNLNSSNGLVDLAILSLFAVAD